MGFHGRRTRVPVVICFSGSISGTGDRRGVGGWLRGGVIEENTEIEGVRCHSPASAPRDLAASVSPVVFLLRLMNACCACLEVL